MFIRRNEDIIGTERDVNWGNGTSLRLLTKDDEMGFTVCTTTVIAGSTSRLKYKNHLEACYCISGCGSIKNPINGESLIINPGTLYVLDKYDDHVLSAESGSDMVLISIFNPPLIGTEKHDLREEKPSHY